MRKLLRTLRHLLRLDEAVTRLAADEAGVREERPVEPEQRLDAADLVLVERPQHPAAGVLAVDALDDQLRDHRVVEAADLAADCDAGVDANPWPDGSR